MGAALLPAKPFEERFLIARLFAHCRKSPLVTARLKTRFLGSKPPFFHSGGPNQATCCTKKPGPMIFTGIDFLAGLWFVMGPIPADANKKKPKTGDPVGLGIFLPAGPNFSRGVFFFSKKKKWVGDLPFELT